MERPVRLVLLGPHTRVLAELCASCPLGPTGCCSTPPDLSWADIARIASLGGVDWLIDEMGAGRLLRGPRGLLVARVAAAGGGRPDAAVAAGGGRPGAAAVQGTKCVYHGEQGCSVSPDRRSAACNYYVCQDALAGAEDENAGVEAASAAWTTQYQIWDEILSSEIGSWAGRGESREELWGLFDGLSSRFRELVRR